MDSYTYGASAGGCSVGTPATKRHAVTQAGSYTFSYDCNGNVITRTAGSDTYGLTYDAESRLHSVTTAGETVAFMYDGDGRRVLRDTITGTIAYVGPHYELRFDKTSKPEDLDGDCRVTVIDIMQVAAHWGGAGGPWDVNGDGAVDVGDVQQVAGVWRETCHVLAETVKYYTLGGRRLPMRKAGTLYYLFSDHLGSTSVAYNTTNGQAQTMRYCPWGQVRAGDVPTDRRFTGQRWDGTIGLYDYNARWYDSLLGRFVQPDSLALTMVEANEAGISPLTVSYSRSYRRGCRNHNRNSGGRYGARNGDWTDKCRNRIAHVLHVRSERGRGGLTILQPRISPLRCRPGRGARRNSLQRGGRDGLSPPRYA